MEDKSGAKFWLASLDASVVSVDELLRECFKYTVCRFCENYRSQFLFNNCQRILIAIPLLLKIFIFITIHIKNYAQKIPFHQYLHRNRYNHLYTRAAKYMRSHLVISF